MVDQAPTKTPDEIEKELSVGNFTKQQARTLGFQFGGMAAGGAAGWGLAKTGLATSMAKNNIVKAMGGAKSVLVIGGTIVGSIIGGVASLYEHWVKVEREQLNVQEINKDVAKLMEKRTQFEDTLDKQSAVIKDMLERTGGNAEKILARREQSAASENIRS